MPEDYNLQSLLQDIANNAAADRAGAWLELAAQDYPQLFGAITDNLHAPAADVYADICGRYPAFLFTAAFIPRDKTLAFISRLQAWFRERNKQ